MLTAPELKVNKGQLMQVLETPPSREFVREELHLKLALNDYFSQGFISPAEFGDESTVDQPATKTVNEWVEGRLTRNKIQVPWNPHRDPVDYYADLLITPSDRKWMAREDLPAFHPTAEILVAYTSDMKKLGTVAQAFSEPIIEAFSSTLPPTFGGFVSAYFRREGIRQVEFAEAASCSQSLLSGVVNDKPTVGADGFLKVVKGLDVEDELGVAVYRKYAPSDWDIPGDVDLVRTPHRERWVADLYNLDLERMLKLGFPGFKEFIINRATNASNRLRGVLAHLDPLPDEISVEDLKNMPVKKWRPYYGIDPKRTPLGELAFPSVRSLDEKWPTSQAIARIWEARIKEEETRIRRSLEHKQDIQPASV